MQVTLVFVLVLVNAVFAGSEMALVSLRESQLQRLERTSRAGRVLARHGALLPRHELEPLPRPARLVAVPARHGRLLGLASLSATRRSLRFSWFERRVRKPKARASSTWKRSITIPTA